MRKALLALAAITSLTAAGTARAQGRSFTHDGFAVQLEAGAGGMSTSASQYGNSAKLSGAAGEFALTAGGVVAENFIIGGQVFFLAASSPSATVNGSSQGSSGTTLGLTGFGPTFTYYFMPVNIYLSATPAIARVTVDQGGQTAGTKSGFAFKLAAGKEWWVSDNWGLGLNLQYIHSSNVDNGYDPPTWNTNWFGAAFSATFN
jgi:hypothetical protein